jgi:hypothetical protein
MFQNFYKNLILGTVLMASFVSNTLAVLPENIPQVQNNGAWHLTEIFQNTTPQELNDFFQKLPEEVALNVKNLLLNNNQLTQIPNSLVRFKNLKNLFLNHNQITAIPTALLTWSSKSIYFYNNPLDPVNFIVCHALVKQNPRLAKTLQEHVTRTPQVIAAINQILPMPIAEEVVPDVISLPEGLDLIITDRTPAQLQALAAQSEQH